MRQVSFSFSVTTTILVLVLFPAGSVASDLSPDTFLKEYRDALKQLQSAYSTVQIEGIIVRSNIDKTSKKLEDNLTLRFSLDRSGKKNRFIHVVGEDGTRAYKKDLFVVGSGQDFHLQQIDGPHSNYRIFRLIDINNDKTSVNFIYKTIVAESALSVSSNLITKLIDSDSFKIKSVQRVPHGPEMLVRVEFDYKSDDPQEIYYLSGWMLLDPERSWAVRSHEVRFDYPPPNKFYAVAKGNVRYRSDGDEIPLPEELTFSQQYFQPDGTSSETRWHFQAERLSTDPIPDSEFTLAAYGLGDVEQPPGAPTNTLPYWAFGFAAVALGISVVLKRMARQA